MFIGLFCVGRRYTTYNLCGRNIGEPEIPENKAQEPSEELDVKYVI